jgi:hypothetical protein
MASELVVPLSLLAKMAVTAGFVVTASLIAERVGPLIGALVATLPISAGPAYLFLSLEHDAAFIADSALASLVTNAATVVFALTYSRLAQRHGVIASLFPALAVWFGLGAVSRWLDWSLGTALLANVAAFVPSLLLGRRLRDVKMPFARRRWYDIPLRAGLVAVLVTLVVTLSSRLGAFATGILAAFPIVLTSLILILHPRVGGRATAAVIANGVSGLIGFAIALAVLHLTAVPLGAPAALALALAICIGWNLLVWFARRHAIPL